ncbi:MAG: 50S ribosomal protein L11 methyltransferase [Desulfuromonas sp.]|nr:MAG: 50S ribosomal protein L11 methyltransferase [Desulfuromonas sp.]
MTNSWLEIAIQAPAEDVDLLCERLERCGSSGVTVAEAELDTFVPPDPDELFVGSLVIRAYFPEQDGELLLERLREELSDFPAASLASEGPQTVRNEDWAEGWKQHFSAVRIGPRLVVRPSWEDFNPGPGDVEVILDPGMAFGTGTHGTTRLCLEALAGCYESQIPPRRVLDVGTGSGILAIAAARLGAEQVVACDIDDEVCRVARDNVVQNRVESLVEVTREPLEALGDGFDLVLANILAEENVRLADELVSRVTPRGTLVLSGILQEKEDFVVDGFRRYFAEPPERFHRDEWSCLVYRGKV